MSILNLDKVQQKKAECSVAIMAAMKAQDDAALDKALGDFADFLGETLAAESEMKNSGAIDKVVLATRGIRQLTQKETNFYQKFIDAAKASDVKMAIGNLNEAIPPTVIDAVLEDVRKAHPLLDRINLRNGSMFTKYLYNKSGKPTIVWGDINSAITNELNADIGYIDVQLKKLSAFMYVPQDMLDLGPAWVDRFVRELLAEYISLGLEASIVDGDGDKQYIGMTRDVSEDAAVVSGKYPRKVAVKLDKLNAVNLGRILKIVATDINGDARPVVNPIMVVNPFDYFEKIMPSTTVRNPDGTFRNDVLPYPMQIIQSAAMPANMCAIGIPERYLAIIGTGEGGKIAYSDEYKFLEDERTYKIKLTGNGRPLDDNAFVLCDITDLKPEILEVVIKNTADEPVNTKEVTGE
ncbi:MAG: phage major capsid protein [Oscillospiraceae bacterium]